MTTELDGEYVQAFLQSAATVSPIFEKKAREVLAEYGISDVDPDGWYCATAFTQALWHVSDAVGEDLLCSVGSKMIPRDGQIASTDDPAEAFEILHENATRSAHRGPDAPEVVEFDVERLGPQKFRIVTGPSYHYPPGLTDGIACATISLSAGVPESEIEVEKVEPEGEESHALVLSW